MMMKTNLLRIMAFLLAMTFTSGYACAQQRKTATKKTATAKRTATTVKKKATPQAQPTVVTIDETALADGRLAFYGIPVKQPQKTVESQLAAKGFKKVKDRYGNTDITGTAYGVKCKVYVDDGRGISIRESKPYTLAQAKKRVLAYKKAYIEATGGKETQNTLEWNNVEGGNITIETASGTVGIQYANQDEVNFDSKYYDVIINIFEN